jgi:DNA-binding NtrC family response regulator
VASVLIVEDEQGLGQTLQMSLTDEGHRAHWVASAEEASAWIVGRQVDLALVDLRLPRRDGIDLLKEFSSSFPEMVVVLMTAHGDVRTAVEAMKLGAADFLLKPVDLDAVSLIASRHLKQSKIARQWQHEQQKQSREFGLDRIIGTCPQVEKAKTLVRRLCAIVANSEASPPNVLITGETGTGKDLIARAIHFEGTRRDASFTHVNCGALPETLAESELFGHVKGAFTDARTNKRGLFDLADGGTLFLDEVCSLPQTVQAKLLTAIESRRFRPVGASEERAVDVQLVSAMNRDPEKLIADGQLRADLYHRLRVVEIALPPLRERGEDLSVLAAHFIASHCGRFRMPEKRMSPAALSALMAYHWPGNIRELSHCLETAVLMGGDVIDEDAMPAGARPRAAHEPAGHVQCGDFRVDFSEGPISLDSVERKMIVRALEEAGYNVTKAATLLDMSRDTLRYRLEKHRINAASPGPVA